MLCARPLATLITAFGMAAVGGCSIIPTSGPSETDIRAQRPLEGDGLEYGFVRLTPETIAIMGKHAPPGLAGAFTDRRPATKTVFGVGDVVSVTIFEAAAGGLLILAV